MACNCCAGESGYHFDGCIWRANTILIEELRESNATLMSLVSDAHKIIELLKTESQEQEKLKEVWLRRLVLNGEKNETIFNKK